MFVAAYPPPEALADFDDFLVPRREHGDFRWTPIGQFHLTMAFFDDVPDRSLDAMVEALQAAAQKRRPLEAAIAGGGAFPHAGWAKVLWAGVEVDDPAELEKMANGCRTAGATTGAPPSGERFRPHLTVARIGRPIEATKWVRLLDGYRGPAGTIDKIALVESHLGESPGRRPRHEIVETFALGRVT